MELINKSFISAVRQIWRREASVNKEQRPESKLMKAGLGISGFLAAAVFLCAAPGFLPSENADAAFMYISAFFSSAAFFDIFRRTAFVFYNDRCSGRSSVMELAPCGFSAYFVIKNFMIIRPWLIEGALLFSAELICVLLGRFSLEIFSALLLCALSSCLLAAGMGLLWSLQEELSASKCAASAAKFSASAAFCLFISEVSSHNQLKMMIWSCIFFLLVWAPRFRICRDFVWAVLAAVLAVCSFIPSAVECDYEVYEASVPCYSAFHAKNLKLESNISSADNFNRWKRYVLKNMSDAERRRCSVRTGKGMAGFADSGRLSGSMLLDFYKSLDDGLKASISEELAFSFMINIMLCSCLSLTVFILGTVFWCRKI